MEKYRSRAHVLLLYPDCESHVEAVKKIEKSYDYAMILHDKDSDENGELKKPHWHIVLRFGQAVWSSAICKELGIEENYIEKPRSFDNALLYLVHFNDSDKYQYNPDDANEDRTAPSKLRPITVFGTISGKACDGQISIITHNILNQF